MVGTEKLRSKSVSLESLSWVNWADRLLRFLTNGRAILLPLTLSLKDRLGAVEGMLRTPPPSQKEVSPHASSSQTCRVTPESETWDGDLWIPLPLEGKVSSKCRRSKAVSSEGLWLTEMGEKCMHVHIPFTKRTQFSSLYQHLSDICYIPPSKEPGSWGYLISTSETISWSLPEAKASSLCGWALTQLLFIYMYSGFCGWGEFLVNGLYKMSLGNFRKTFSRLISSRSLDILATASLP